MNILDLKNKIFCNKKTTDFNFSFKESFNALIEGAKTRIRELWNKVPSFSTITAQIKKTVGDLKDEVVDQAKDVFQNINDQIDNAIESAKDIKEFTGDLLSCPQAKENIPDIPTINPTADTFATPSTNNDEINNLSSDIKTKKALEDAKSQKLSTTATAIIAANNELSEKGIVEIRETVKVLSKPHPILNNIIEQLKYFQPISQTVGEAFFGYTIDKPSLQLADWSSSAKAIRVSSKSKVRSDIAYEIDNSYTGLNKQFVSNISNEFITERRSIPFNTAHNYHIAGDSLFAVDHISSDRSTLRGGLLQILTNIIAEQITLINYLNPIKPAYVVAPDYYTTNAENHMVVVDKRNNIVRKPFIQVDNTALMPKDLPEA